MHMRMAEVGLKKQVVTYVYLPVLGTLREAHPD